MTIRVVIFACFIFGASQALAAISRADDHAAGSHHTSLTVKLPDSTNQQSEDNTVIAPSITVVLHYWQVPNVIPALIVLSVLVFSFEDSRISFDQSPPARNLFKVLFRFVIAPNAP